MKAVRTPVRRAALLAVLLAAFAVRLWQSEAQSIWGDEAFSIFTAKQDIANVVSGGADLHPPLYHLLLHYWLEASGRTPFALRLLSGLWSLVGVAAGYALAHRATADRHLALLAGALIAISPFQVFYAQETRMYAQAAALCALSLALLLRWLADGSRGVLLAWGIATLAALYSHFFAFFVLAAQDLYLLWLLRAGPREGRMEGQAQAARVHVGAMAAAQGMMALAYLPWALAQRDYLNRQANARTAALSLQSAWDVLARSLSAFYAGTTLDGWWQAGAALACLALAAVGLLAMRRSGWLPLLAVAVPLVGAIAVNPLLPYFRERFLLPASVPFLILVAAGLRRLPRLAGAAAGLALAGVAVLALWNYASDPRYHKGEYAQAIAAIRAGAAPGDAVIRYAPIQDALWDYYRIEDMADYALPDADLATVAAQHPRAWLLLYGDPAVFDPQGGAEAFLSARGFKAFAQGYRDGALARYDFLPVNTPPLATRVQFADGITLAGVAVPGTVARGKTLPVMLQWQASVPPGEDYTVFVHVRAADGNVLAQMDSRPQGGTRPTRSWQAGETVRDQLGVPIPAQVPPGRYQVVAGMYLLRTLQRLAVRDAGGLPAQADAVVIGAIEVR